ncbi:MFS transporter [Qaidamihabitans albus]|uniref:MFS transporter n=1 Tax=Qaidamihabitans albus TaxID=2795733 RepID=UPI0018F257C8|nr:MFS transporter [Qaidamihabitans albus]
MTEPPTPPVGTPLAGGRPRAADPRRWWALAVLGTVQAVFVLDLTVVNVALPSIRADLGFAESGLAWVVNGYALMAGGLLLLGGRSGDLFGRKRLFLVGTGLFTAASLAAGLAQEPWMLVAGRFAQGVGDALAAPAIFGIVATTFTEPGERSKALGVLAGLSGVGGTLGITLSGLLNEYASWRWVFLINVPVGLVAMLLAGRFVARGSPGRDLAGRTDVLGALTLTGGSLGIVYAVLRSADHRWTDPSVTGPLALGVLLAAAFVVVERRSAQPLVPLGFFRDRVRVAACVASLLFASGFFAMFFLLTLFVRGVLGWSALGTGLAYVPYGLLIVGGATTSSMLVPRVGARAMLVCGSLVTVAGLALLALLIGPDATFGGAFLPATLVIGLGAGLTLPTLTVGALHRVTEDNAGLASGVQTSASHIGSSLGIAVLVAVSTTVGPSVGGGAGAATAVDGFRAAILTAAAAAALAAAIAGWLVGPDAGKRVPAEPTRAARA